MKPNVYRVGLLGFLCPLRGRMFGCRFRPADGFISFAPPKEIDERKDGPAALRNPVFKAIFKESPELAARYRVTRRAFWH